MKKLSKNSFTIFLGAFLLITSFTTTAFLININTVSADCTYDTGEPAPANPDGSCPEHSKGNGNQPSQINNYVDLINTLSGIIDLVAPFLIGLSVLFIIYGLVGYISSAANEEKRTEAKNFIIWGIIFLFLMISIWGLVNILLGTFRLNPSSSVVTQVYRPFNNGEATKNPTTVLELIDRMNSIGSRLIPFFISIAVFIVIIGIVGYIRQADNEEKRAEARMFILWGVFSIFFMLSIWGLVNILLNTFNLNNALPTIPALPKL